MTRVMAAVAVEASKPLEFQELELDAPGPDEVLVKMVAAGVCHTDLVVRDTPFPPSLPAVLGHEGAGVVCEVGSAVRGLAPGDPVALSFASCGQCKLCLRGRPAYCEQFLRYNMSGSRPDGSPTLHGAEGAVGGNFFYQSSFATHSIAHASNVVKVGEQDALDLVAPLGCGVQTGAGAVLNVLRPEPGSSFIVFGAGSVGLSALLAAVARYCFPVIAVDVHMGRLQLAKELGASHALDGREPGLLEEIRSITGGVDFAVDTTGRSSVSKCAVDSLGMGGVLAQHGLFTDDAEGMNIAALPAGKTVMSLIEGDSVPQVMIPALLSMHAQARFPFDRLIRHYPFEDINQAIADSEAGETVKAVLRFPE
jgi:aryl-alcohol dehydrogenase